MSRVNGSSISSRNPFGPVWGSKQKDGVESLRSQIEDALFSRKRPQVVDADDALTTALMARLQAYLSKIIRLANVEAFQHRLLLAEGTIAMIDATGTIYFSRSFMLQTADDVDLQVGVLAHEVGHRPHRWSEYQSEQPRTKDEIHALCRAEETQADYFAGRALAALSLSPKSLCDYLVAVTDRPHPEYFEPKLRVSVILEGYQDGLRKDAQKRAFFPAFAKATEAKNDLGSG